MMDQTLISGKDQFLSKLSCLDMDTLKKESLNKSKSKARERLEWVSNTQF